MKNLFKEDGIGIFDNELKLIDIKGDDDLLTKQYQLEIYQQN